jgi:hypothetical protein
MALAFNIANYFSKLAGYDREVKNNNKASKFGQV